MCHALMVWHIETLKYWHQLEEPKASIKLFTNIRVQKINIFTQKIIFRRNTVHRNDQNSWERLEIKRNIRREI